jgi:hypothetical protein
MVANCLMNGDINLHAEGFILFDLSLSLSLYLIYHLIIADGSVGQLAMLYFFCFPLILREMCPLLILHDMAPVIHEKIF